MSRNRSSGKAAPLWASQNFLTSRVVIERLLAKTTIGPLDHVVEIGPGKGHSTAGLIERSGKVSAVELDGRLFEALRTKFAGIEKLRLYRGDFMSWQLPAAGVYKVFANIPFLCTTAIIKKLAGCGTYSVHSSSPMRCARRTCRATSRPMKCSTRNGSAFSDALRVLQSSKRTPLSKVSSPKIAFERQSTAE